MSTPEGLDLDAFARWLDEQAPGLLVGPLEASLITGGKSNLTYAVTDGRRDVIVRRPPLGHVLATAHDMGREHRVIAALADTAVPVPTITGRMVDVLADLHAVDPDDVGLGDFGRPDGYLERQVRRWKKQLDASRSRELPGMDELVARLESSIPDTGEGTIVHGDYRLDNLLVDASPDGGDQVTAVLDWEMSTLGDPLTDVAVLLAYQQLAEEAGAGAGAGLVTDAAQAPGYLSRDEVLARYAQQSGRDVSDIDFHLALAFFKLAVILEGIHFRHSHGQTLGAGFDGIGDLIEPLIQAGLRA